MHNRKRWFVRLVCAIGAMGLVAVGAGEAFADSAPVNVNASVTIPNATALTGITGTITFASSLAGQMTQAQNAEQYTVTTNDTAGATLEVQQPVDGALDGPTISGTTQKIAFTNIGILQTTQGSTNGPFNFAPQNGGSFPALVLQNDVTGTQSFSDTWNLNIPAGQFGGAYSGTVVYLALSN